MTPPAASRRPAARLRRAGFERVRHLPVPGRQPGIAHTFVARTPPAPRQAA